jgi:hypothetical protein
MFPSLPSSSMVACWVLDAPPATKMTAAVDVLTHQEPAMWHMWQHKRQTPTHQQETQAHQAPNDAASCVSTPQAHLWGCVGAV